MSTIWMRFLDSAVHDQSRTTANSNLRMGNLFSEQSRNFLKSVLFLGFFVGIAELRRVNPRNVR